MEQHSGTILITGASSGLGQACALALAGKGFRVLAGVRQDSDGERLLGSGCRDLTPLRLDVCDGDSIEAAVGAIADKVGAAGLQGLVNNAGIVIAGPLECIPIEALRQQLEVNVVGLVAVTQAVLPLLRRGRGRIVNMGSLSGRIVTPFLGPYCASKFALEALSDALRMELAPWDIPVSLLEPGPVSSPIWDRTRRRGAELAAAAPPESQALYAEALSRFERAVAEIGRLAPGPEAVIAAVLHALTAPVPRVRYPLGRFATWQILAARLIPRRLLDRLIRRRLTA